MSGMNTRRPPNRQPDTERFDHVTLADGSTVAVARANLAAAKGLLAAQKAADRRVAADRLQRKVATTAATPSAPRHPQTAWREHAIYSIAAAARRDRWRC